MRGLWARPRVIRHAVDAISGTFGRVRERFWPVMRLILIEYEGGLSRNRRPHVEHLYLCLSLRSPRYHLFPDVLFVLTLRTPQFMLLDRNLLAKGCLGRYE